MPKWAGISKFGVHLINPLREISAIYKNCFTFNLIFLPLGVGSQKGPQFNAVTFSTLTIILQSIQV